VCTAIISLLYLAQLPLNIVRELFDTATELAVATRSESLLLVNIAIGLMTQGAFIFSRILALVANPPLLLYVM